MGRQQKDGDEEKEIYLLLIVHGIGSNLEHQKECERELHQHINMLTEGDYFRNHY